MGARAFTQADIKRAATAAKAAGLAVGAIEIAPNGTIRILVADAVKAALDPFEEFERADAESERT